MMNPPDMPKREIRLNATRYWVRGGNNIQLLPLQEIASVSDQATDKDIGRISISWSGDKLVFINEEVGERWIVEVQDVWDALFHQKGDGDGVPNSNDQ